MVCDKDWRAVRWTPIWTTLPTQFALCVILWLIRTTHVADLAGLLGCFSIYCILLSMFLHWVSVELVVLAALPR